MAEKVYQRSKKGGLNMSMILRLYGDIHYEFSVGGRTDLIWLLL